MAERRRRVPDIAHAFQMFMFYRDEASSAEKEKTKQAALLRDAAKEAGKIARDGDGNETNGGNIEYRLDKPMQLGDKTYAGWELRKSPQVSFDEDKAVALAKRKGVYSQVTHTVTTVVVDQDAFYVLNQQGKLTDAELDGLLVEGEPRYALWPLLAVEDD